MDTINRRVTYTTRVTNPESRKAGERSPSMPAKAQNTPKHPEISFKDLRPGEYAMVKGTVTWSRIASLIDGDELAKKVQRQKQAGRMKIIDVPHVSIAIDNAVVVGPHDPSDPSKIAANGTIEQKYLDNRLFTTVPDPNARYQYHGERFSIDERSFDGNLPPVFRVGNPAKGENPKTFYQFYPKADLAIGTKVIIVMRAYGGRMDNNGMGLRAILVNETDIQYRNGGGANYGLKNDLKTKLHINVELTEKPEYEGAEAVAAAQRTSAAPTDIPNVNTVPAAPQQVVNMPDPTPVTIDDPGLSGIDIPDEPTPGIGIDDDFDPSDLYT